MSSTQVFIGVGSNIERHQNIRAGINALQQQVGALHISSVYESMPIGFSAPPFFNLVVSFTTHDDVFSVYQRLKDIEHPYDCRVTKEKFTSRALDLDLLLFGDAVLAHEQFNLPRKDIEIYPFVLEPLAEIAPNLVHPTKKITYLALWLAMDKRTVKQKKIAYSELLL
ncbi:MAG: 2-amino-4-hydroxy-6-hydroxymethyldihydropteridine diphosphokinase [Methylovulum sp.]|jgi:2-amino-4-hydroxy-6-hydroxymethyldihydropteridine diphosphokinase|nr:2-amino-4-hydroxy-6-hydroxymethyldihydropteridine diphosphokinase [Methylovulum sp.]TSA41974.1 MAG: 2-amino-4-hydroxy-6-hydroxymethyldihydropteridine diphosphokinase [Methylococcaceae bacterium]